MRFKKLSWRAKFDNYKCQWCGKIYKKLKWCWKHEDKFSQEYGMIIDTDNLQSLSTDDMQMAIRSLTHALIVKSYNVRVIPDVCDTLGIRELDEK